MKLCRHASYKAIDWILEPTYSKDTIKISVYAITDNIEHYLIKFKKCNKYPDWFYMSGKMIRKQPVVPNGRGKVYEVPMSKREEFEKIEGCEHEF